VADRDRSARELGWFFALALGATAILHGSIALLGLRFSLSAASPSILLYMLGLAAPAVAALVLTGPAGRSRFLRSALRPRGSARIYVAAVLAQAGVLATAWVLLRAKGEPASLGFSLSSAFPFFALGQVWVVLGEELGWRAFALARLERMLSPRLATLVLALAWGVWHAPCSSWRVAAGSRPRLAVRFRHLRLVVHPHRALSSFPPEHHPESCIPRLRESLAESRRSSRAGSGRAGGGLCISRRRHVAPHGPYVDRQQMAADYC